jgi:DNA-binding NtrC family response regulator
VTPLIAILDDEKRMVEILQMVLRKEGYETVGFNEPESALRHLSDRGADLLLTDLRMPGADGVEVLRRTRAIDPELPVILLTAHATVATAVEAMRQGAFDYVEKPFDNDELKALVRRALDVTRLSRENRYLRAELRGQFLFEAIVAESDAMCSALELARRAARSPSTVLITGESGCGKELVARTVHVHSDRLGSRFVAVNCKAIAEGLLESELFGHVRGAFTGAERERAGLFEQAEGGTLFLDEIGETSLEFQAKLLRVLQERVVRRVGANEDSRKLDVRVVAATNRDLRSEIEAGRFREDLYFRLAVIPIALAPLRERPEDVLPLARHFFEKWNRELGRKLTGWSEEVDAHLRGYTWPGNVRELEIALERAVVLARGAQVELEDLMIDPKAQRSPDSLEHGPLELRAALDVATAEHVRRILDRTGGARSEAARLLGIDRTTLYRLMKKVGIADE